MRTGETIADGRAVAEAEVSRKSGGEAPFQVRAGGTVYSGFRNRRGKRLPDGDAPPGLPGRSFQVRAAVTVTLPPPHWAALTQQTTQQEESHHVPHSGPDADRGRD